MESIGPARQRRPRLGNANDPIILTTPIYYVNGPPHLGHAACTLAADTVARLHRARGREVFFQTGTDEHGISVERAAAAEGLAPQGLADRNAATFQKAWQALDIDPDRFLRTTEPAHHRAALELWRRLAEAGELRRGVYEGFYCAPCEAFLSAEELDPGETCPVHHRVCEWQREENTFFRLSRHAAALRRLVAETGFVQPASRRAEVLTWIGRGLPDLSLTRSSVRWGIPAPGLPGEVLYVFGVDALANYLTGLGFPDPALESAWRGRFPHTVHVIGKEILRFHALYWPAFLRAAGLPLPKQLRVHGHFTVEGQKLSKTAGNGIDPVALAEEVGSDALRFFALRSKPFDRDGDFSRARARELWNAELAGGLGNWAQRVTRLVSKHRAGRSPVPPPLPRAEEAALLEAATALCREADERTTSFAFDRALQSVARLVQEASRHLERTKPWALAGARDPHSVRRFDEIAAAHLTALRSATRSIAPYTPRAAAALGERLGAVVREGPAPYPRLP